MRASSLSDAKVITLLNRFFVPVFVSSEDDAEWGAAEPAERAEYQRILAEAQKSSLSSGTVHVYILTPDAHVLDSMHVAEASKPEQLISVLERTVQKLKPRPGYPVVKPATVSVPPKHDADALVLHLTARVLKGGSGWEGFPVEDWVVFKRRQVTAFLPPAQLGAGKSWDIDKEVAGVLLKHFYPATENNDISSNRIEHLEMKGRLLPAADGLVRVRLSGYLKMKHTFYRKEDDNLVEATLTGFLEFDSQKKAIRSFRLVTYEAAYGRGTFAVAVRSVP